MQKLNLAFNFAIRYVYDLRSFDRISSWRKDFIGCSLENYIVLQNLIFLHKLLQSQTPCYLFEKISFYNSERVKMLQTSKYNYLESSRYFFVSTIREWNRLPNTIRCLSEGNSFKDSLLQQLV